MTDINAIRKKENEQVYQHLLAIRKIMAHKCLRKGKEKAVAELVLNGLFQFSFKYGLEAFSCPTDIEALQKFDQQASVTPPVKTSAAEIHKENRDWVRHLIAIRNIRNTKCARCDYYNCQGCSLSGREFFNIASALKLIMLYDWEAIHEVLGVEGYYDETNALVYTLEDCLGRNEQIIMAKPEYETNY